jgi:hypothetical protein
MKGIQVKHIMAALLIVSVASAFSQKPEPKKAELIPIKMKNFPDRKRVDVTAGNALFTSYMYADSLEKPFLFPIVAADGITVTRGFPIAPRPGEGVDHPHHTGYWFNYGNVNGINFWGNSKGLPPAEKAICGVIRLKNIEKSESLSDKGILVVNQEWVGPDGAVPLKEHTTFIFRAGKNFRIIDHITTLTAQVPLVSFPDTKEGAFAIRVARFLEFPSKEPKIFVDAQGQVTKIPVMNNEGVNGNYLSSEGIRGAGVWGTRARWMNLFGVSGSDTVSIVFMDHPSNPNYPTYWHARDYGLFSANPFGEKDFTQGKEELNFKLKKGESVTFRHRLFIKSGKGISPSEVEKEWKEFCKE